jgi:glutathione S-transferase
MLRRHALANGIIDAAFNVSSEIKRRDEGERSPKWIKHWLAAISRGVHELDREIGDWSQDLDLAHITAGCTLSYLDIRLSKQLDWRAGHPTLAVWHEAFAARPSMVSTQPKM